MANREKISETFLCYIIVMKIHGVLQLGKGIGRKMGFPTINIPYDGQLSGVFAAKVFCNDKEYCAAVNLGTRPTFDDQENLCEVFLIDVHEDFAPGTSFQVKLIKKIRDIQKFDSVAQLQEQIAKDVDFVKMTLC